MVEYSICSFIWNLDFDFDANVDSDDGGSDTGIENNRIMHPSVTLKNKVSLNTEKMKRKQSGTNGSKPKRQRTERLHCKFLWFFINI